MQLNEYIDHTLLKPDAQTSDIEKLCEEAKKYHFAAVCVNSIFVADATRFLFGSAVKVCTVVGFPLGASDTQTKVFEAKKAIDNGAHEIDMVIPIGKLKEGDDEYVLEDIKAVSEAVTAKGAILKVIVESCLLSNEELAKVSKLVSDAGAAFIKTSTGFSTSGASIEAVKIMKENISDQVKIKASGGIRDKATALEYINLGVSRIGTSSGIAIVS